jgi:hypothetical protein
MSQKWKHWEVLYKYAFNCPSVDIIEVFDSQPL